MGYISKNWHGVKNSINISQKFLNKIKPETALKNRIGDAEKKLECQISRLTQVHSKLKQNHDQIFKKIVDAKLVHDESRARTYALELQEIKKDLKVTLKVKSLLYIFQSLSQAQPFPQFDVKTNNQF